MNQKQMAALQLDCYLTVKQQLVEMPWRALKVQLLTLFAGDAMHIPTSGFTKFNRPTGGSKTALLFFF